MKSYSKEGNYTSLYILLCHHYPLPPHTHTYVPKPATTGKGSQHKASPEMLVVISVSAVCPNPLAVRARTDTRQVVPGCRPENMWQVSFLSLDTVRRGPGTLMPGSDDSILWQLIWKQKKRCHWIKRRVHGPAGSSARFQFYCSMML